MAKGFILKGSSIFIIILFLIPTTYATDPTGLNDNDLVQSISTTYHFDEPKLIETQVNGTVFETVFISNLSSLSNPGEPCLPVYGAYILLPPDSIITEISCEYDNQIHMNTNHHIIPGSTPTPIYSNQTIETPEPNPKIYQQNDFYPASLYTEIGVYILRGYQIAVFRINPVQYNPLEGCLLYYPDLKLTITVETTQNISRLYRGIPLDSELVTSKVDNAWMMDYWYEPTTTTFDDPYDLLILTTDELADGFIPLKEAHEQQGLRTMIKTLREVSLIPSQITAENIRSFIQDEYVQHGIEYVLLGGDADIVPAAMLWVSGLDEDTYYYDTTLPADFYFGCLDGEFNGDKDDHIGEPTDGDNGGDVDLFAEVQIGRAPVGSLDEVTNFVSKTITYLLMDPTDPVLSKVLLAGEHLGEFGIASWGGNYLDLLINGSDIDGYSTIGVPEERFDIERLYDRDYDSNSWPSTEIINRVNEGLHILNHDGHSNYGYNMKMVNNDVSLFTNEQPFFDYSVGCMAGGFDDPVGYDCFAEYLTVKNPYGAFASIMNARYGFFWAFSTDGDGTRYTREFWDAVFGENIACISKANQDSKEDNIFLIDRSCMRWTFYELNLFGDPSVSFYVSLPPEEPMIQGNVNGKPGIEYNYTFTAFDPENETMMLFVEFQSGQGFWIDTSINSGEVITIPWTWNEQGTYTVRAKARDTHGMESPWATLEVSMPHINQQSVWLWRLFEQLHLSYPLFDLEQFCLLIS